MLTKSSNSSGKDYFDDLIAELGGVEALRDEPNDFRKAVNHLWDEHDLLVEQHPHKWVSVGKDGVVAVGDSIEEVVAATEESNVNTSDVVVEYLNPEPETLIL